MTATLRERLVARIAAEGPLDFAAYVEAALYDPAAGFYARGARIGRGGAFATAPTAHPAFAAAVAAEARATYAALGSPPRLSVVEVGPGDGTLAAALGALLGDLPLELVLVERAAGMRALQAERLAAAGVRARHVERPADVPPGDGLVVANELLDALPFHLLRWPDEVRVGADAAGALVEVAAPAPPALGAALERSGIAPRSGARYAVRPDLPAVTASIARCIGRGTVLVVDYGGEGAAVHDGRRDPVRTFVGGQPGGAALAAPGRQDLTADVDFGDVRRGLAEAGCRDVEVLDQGAWLARHGAALAAPAARDDAGWLLAGLMDPRLPFVVARAVRDDGR